jgi:hypothetical protein
MTQTFLFSYAKLLILLHAASAVVLIGASTHHTLIAVGYLRGVFKVRLGRIYAAAVPVAYAATYLLGCLSYPTYRYHVRALYLDRHEVWASNLFDVKENFASLALPLVIGIWLLSRVLDPGSGLKTDRSLTIGYAMMVFLSTGIVWFNVISGLLITMAKGMP